MKIELKNIRFSYSENEPVLRDASFVIEKGAFAFVIGRNGEGKSTLLKLIARILAPAGGEIIVGGKSLSEYESNELARVLAYVPQNYVPVFPFTVYDFVATGRTPYLNFYGVLKNKDREIIEHGLELLGIENLARKSVTEISGGEFRRALIARAVAQETDIILLDEPSAFLDIEHQISIFELLKKLNEERSFTIITVSHDLNLTGMFASEIILLENGKAIKFDKREILTRERIKEHFNVNSMVTATDENINVTITRAR